jgi:NAD(P)-dependent dehydrogenase (short-subunit alcohol dehydrogenase family)
MPIDINGRVVIVTGAGAGLGAAYAALLGRLGARVVVNGRPTDDGRRRIEAVVEGIRNAGGTAIAAAHDIATIAGATALVSETVAAFGTLHGLVNNAGIVRDRSFHKADPADLDAVIATNLLGTLYCTRAAWPHMLEAGHGRVVMTTSMAGTSGNFGQAAYGAAKAGVIGLMQCLALEGQRSDILVNCVSPAAATGMTAKILSPEQKVQMAPEHVAPLIAWAVSPACAVSGRIFTAGRGGFGRMQYFENAGVRFGSDAPAECTMVANAMAAIDDMDGAMPAETGARIRAAFD